MTSTRGREAATPTSLRVFLSFSGKRGALLAEALAEWLPRVLPGIRPWLSRSIAKGTSWPQELLAILGEHDAGILCLTPESRDAPWIAFEAGALWRGSGKARVCPVLLGMRAADLSGPLALLNPTELEKKEVLRLVETLDDLVPSNRGGRAALARRFSEHWPSLSRRVEAIEDTRLPADAATVASIVRAISGRGLPERAGGAHAQFDGGFESHTLYATVLAEAKERLYVFGRKNRKLFDKEHRKAFAGLAGRVESGLDLRLLFLNPAAPAPVLATAHADADFPAQLDAAVRAGRAALAGCGLAPSRHARLYTAGRTVAMVVVDDAVLYCPVVTNARGVAKGLTDAPFSVVSRRSTLGQALCREFLALWRDALPLAP